MPELSIYHFMLFSLRAMQLYFENQKPRRIEFAATQAFALGVPAG